MKIRPFGVLVHRYSGLAMTVFLVIVGLTGSFLAFYKELDSTINPQLYVEANGRSPLEPLVLIEHAALHAAPKADVQSLWMSPEAAQISVSPRLNAQTGKLFELDFDQLIVDPYTGEELGRRQWGSITEGMINLMPFIYKLHFNLALGEWGKWILGITALIWTVDCFVGFYLTLPAKLFVAQNNTSTSASFCQRWRRSWTIKWRGSSFRINYDLHRAGGLWVWLALLVFAWSSVYMNLSDTVYQKVMQSVSDYHQPWTDIGDLPEPLTHPTIDLRQAYLLSHQAMSRAATEHGFEIEAPVAIWFNSAKGFYVYCVRSSTDIQDHAGQTRVVIDASTGEQKMLLLASGQYNGNTVTSWLMALHMANIFGLPYRIFVCALGLIIVMLSVTGVVIWLKKRR
ncbi:PepSY-associated TM helix domain-containing protein [Methylotuvimicrobium buryatense]|uniref:PepSY domain-containing protein n=1 Tax=Methylotuvimicrobium buryatense TaxID=95641 RepID=A0A4P9UQN6_METBY|nr:PepSY-associated TM helix domain-containing protein [Methylotuvimicrobium buryatense]QCW82863.1 PepSY domain-containing protein [Methylotuvimicrobium buryatense]